MSENEEQMKHVDEMTLLMYVERQLDRARGQEVSAHMQECESCRTLLRALERETRLLTRALLEEDEPLPSRLMQFQEKARRGIQWIWGLVFGLAASGAYALYTGYIQPWQAQLEQAGFGNSNLLGLLIFQGAFWKGWQSMITLLEVLAMVTLGGLAVMFFRKKIRGGSALAVVLTGFCVLLGLPSAASATEFRKGESVEVPKDETVKGDIYITGGGRARIDGTVDGDLIVFCRSLDISGHVTGDVIVFSQSARISGQVDGNIRGFNNNITISGTVGKNVMVFDQAVTVDSNGKIAGSFTSFSESLNLDGKVGRDALLYVAQANLSGNIGGEIRAKGHALVISSSAVINGPTRWEGDNQAEVAPGAKLGSPVEFKQMERKREYRDGDYYLWRVIWTAAFVLFGMVLFLLVPRFAAETITAAESYGAPIGLGILVFFGVPIAAIIACFTVVGIPLAVFVVAFWMLMLCCAEIVVGGVVGNLIFGKTSDTWGMIGRMALGFAIVRIVYTPLSHVHVVGFLAALGIWMWGMGAISLALYKRLQPVISPIIPSAPSMPPMPPNTTVGGATA
jgi:cytoskeletal protein CcmA (bactofilin family)